MNIKKIIKSLMVWKKVVPTKIPTLQPGDRLSGKTAIVSGGTSGIGLAIATKLKNNGCEVYILGRSENKLKEVSNELGCKYKVLDISKTGTIEGVVGEIFNETSVDILVNSAGVLKGKGFGQTSISDFDDVFNTNVKGTYFLTQAVTNKMKEMKIKGHVLNLSSSSSLRPCNSVYNISKHIITDMTEGFAKELVPYGIVVNAIAPGPTATKMMGTDENDLFSSTVPAGRFATAEEIANLAVFMLSDFANMIVGSTFYITGGSGITTKE